MQPVAKAIKAPAKKDESSSEEDEEDSDDEEVIITYTHHQQRMKSVGSHESWQQDTGIHNEGNDLILCATLI
jgi:hypothetical protein